MTAAPSAQSVGDLARKAQEQRDKTQTAPAKTYTNESLTRDQTAPQSTPIPEGQSGKQVTTLFDLGLVGNSGGAISTFLISGHGYAGTSDDRRRAGLNREPDDVVQVIVADAKDPVLPSCLNLLVPEVFMEHAVQISGTGHFEPRSPGDDPHRVTLRLDTLSQCTAVPRR